MSVTLKTLFGIGILDIERCDEILKDCDIDAAMFGNFVEQKVSERNLSPLGLDIIGLAYEFILMEARKEILLLTDMALTVDIHVSANSLATNYDYRILESDRIREHLELVPEYEASNLLKFFKRKFM